MAVSDEYPEKKTWLGNFLIIALILSVTVFVKFGLPVPGGKQIFLAFVIVSILWVFGYLTKALSIQPARLGLYLLCMGIFALGQLYNYSNASIISFVIVALMHIPFIFRLKEDKATPGIELIFFRKLMIVTAGLGIFQFFIQFIIGSYWAFPLDHIVPDAFIMQSFFGLRTMEYGSTVYKPTAFYLLEPSNLSQLMALAIIIEMIFFRSLIFLALFLITLALTFSGTGLIPLFLIAPFILMYQRQLFLLVAGGIILLTAPFWALYVGLDKTVDRADEVFHKGSSGYARFVGPYESIRDFQVSKGIDHVIFGMGAGTLNDVPQKDYEVATATWAKLFFEYGLLGTIFYLLFFGYCIFSTGKSGFIIAAFMIIFWVMGENLFLPTYHNLIFALLLWPNYKKEEFTPKEKIPFYIFKPSSG